MLGQSLESVKLHGETFCAKACRRCRLLPNCASLTAHYVDLVFAASVELRASPIRLAHVASPESPVLVTNRPVSTNSPCSIVEALRKPIEEF